jgi:hypothetical protein
MTPPKAAPKGRAPAFTVKKIAETLPSIAPGVTVCLSVVEVIVQRMGPTPNRKKENPAKKALGIQIVSSIAADAKTEKIGPIITALPNETAVRTR